jgi:Fic family protein
MTFRVDRPYNDLPALPPETDLETQSVLKACIAARAALVELRISGQLIPNPAILINSIPLLEARASSEIENIVTTTDRLFRFAARPSNDADPATREAFRYRTALSEGFEALKRKPLSTRTAVAVCRTIKGATIDVRSTGSALVNDATGRVIYTPPEGSRLLRDKLRNWEEYIHSDDGVDPLVKLAVQHYQFEAIHPFADGNGRTGRIINLLFLVERKLLDLPVIYLSRAIIRNKATYYGLLLEVTSRGAWEVWILFMIEAVRETASWTTARIRSIRDLLDLTSNRIRERAPRIHSRELAELLFIQPYCRIGNLVDAGIAKRQAASTYLRTLAEIGVLEERRVGRDKLFLNPALLNLLSDEGEGTDVKGPRRRGPSNSN